MPAWLTGAKRYRDQAEHCRRLAEEAGSLEIRLHYLEIAGHYIALAEAEERLARHGVCGPEAAASAPDRDEHSDQH